MRVIALLAVLTVAGCSSNDKDEPVDDAPQTANVVQVQYPGLAQTDYAPSLSEVFVTGRDSYWMCSFTTADGPYWQTAFYVYADGTGESVYNFMNPNVPDQFNFTWSGEQSFDTQSAFGDVSLYNHNFRTDPDEVVPDAIYEFLADSSDGGLALCSKIAGEW